jgi:hypothetical protein
MKPIVFAFIIVCLFSSPGFTEPSKSTLQLKTDWAMVEIFAKACDDELGNSTAKGPGCRMMVEQWGKVSVLHSRDELRSGLENGDYAPESVDDANRIIAFVEPLLQKLKSRG